MEQPDRLDRFVGAHLPVSRRVLRAWIDQEHIKVNDKKAPKGRKLAKGDRVVIELAGDPDRPLVAEPPPPAVLAETDDWFALDKPAGLPSHPKLPFETGTALTRLLSLDAGIATAGDDPLQGGLAHRLDPGTSGVLVAARHPEAWHRLRQEFSSGRVEKLYLARVRAQKDRAVPLVVDRRLAPCRGDDTRVAWQPSEMSSNPRVVRTEVRTLDDRWLVLRIRSGHRHQIRAHLASIGCPIDGDDIYGGAPASRLYLHAWALQLPGHGWIVSPPPENWNIPVSLEPRVVLNRFRRRPVRSPRTKPERGPQAGRRPGGRGRGETGKGRGPSTRGGGPSRSPQRRDGGSRGRRGSQPERGPAE